MTTLQDVAQAAGVSISTVSYAMSGTRKVSEQTKQKVRQAMLDLNYTPNESARSLASKRTRTLSLLMPAGINSIEGTVSEIIIAASKAAHRRNYRLLVWPSSQDKRDGNQERWLPGEFSPLGAGDGAILMEVLLEDPRIQWLQQSDTPVVLVGRTREPGDVSAIDIDFESGIKDAVAKLREFGHHRIGMVNHSETSREVGYGPTVRSEKAFLEIRGDDAAAWHLHAPESVGGGYAAMKKLLQDHPGISAVVVMNERASFGVQHFVQEQKHRGQQTISIITVASSPGVGELANPSFASFVTPAETLGSRAVNMLIDQIEHIPPKYLGVVELAPCPFVQGRSLERFKP